MVVFGGRSIADWLDVYDPPVAIGAMYTGETVSDRCMSLLKCCVYQSTDSDRFWCSKYAISPCRYLQEGLVEGRDSVRGGGTDDFRRSCFA